MFILDTNVVSELRVARRAAPRVLAWARSVDAASCFLSAVTVLEIGRGVLSAERRDPSKGQVLRQWFDGELMPGFSGRVLSVDVDVALACAGLHVPNPRSFADALIAATAIVHSMTVVTRDTADFAPMGCAILDPWI